MPAPTKINWALALQDYMTDEKMSYAKIAEKYGVSVTAVEQRGSEEGWAKLRLDTWAKVRQNAINKGNETIEKLNDQHNALANALLARAAEAVGKKDKNGNWVYDFQFFREITDAIEKGVRIQRTAHGLDDKQAVQLAQQINVTLPSWYTNTRDKIAAKQAAEDEAIKEANKDGPSETSAAIESQPQP